MGKGRPRTQLLSSNLDHQIDDNDDNKRKMIHREIEKQRRKEMATLHAQLRSLIPVEYIKGKRSMSDHMNGAVNYIKSSKTRIAELGALRDGLIRDSDNSRDSTNGSSNYMNCSSCVAVHRSSAGVEIILSSSAGREATLPLSRLLKQLLGQGLTLLSCVSTKVSDQRSLHNIQAEVKDATCVNVAELQQTLNETILSLNNKSPSR